MPSISDTAVRRRRTVAALVAAPLFLSALALSAPAHADPVPDPNVPAVDARAECESPAFGGVFVTDVQNDVPRSVCQYIVSGSFYYDTYENGTYIGTAVYKDGATVPTERPVIPETLSIPDGFPIVPVQFPF